MSAIMGLDFSKNYSFFTVPVAFLLCMFPGTYSVFLAGKAFDASSPRQMTSAVLSDDKMGKVRQQRIVRAQAAMANGFETLGLYAAGVLAANFAGVDAQRLNLLTGAYLASRVGYIYAYVELCQNRKMAPVRSLFWTTGIACLLSLWVMAGLKSV